ncbi:MAG: carboxypeptidase-like regulatory domain-containing protein [Acidobacteriia bacterium]|nr:carboxypeptidase-like regulatory domain-containing protein [Terriglobia bacterium]
MASMKRVLLIVAVVLVSLQGFAGKDDDIGPVAHLHFVVVRAYNGKPVRNAPVVLHFVNEKGKQERGGLELKTDAEGRASYEGVPYGKLRVQVLARGFQTFGADYDINQPAMDITIRLNRPSGQYSIYEEHPGEKPPEEKKPGEKKNDPK